MDTPAWVTSLENIDAMFKKEAERLSAQYEAALKRLEIAHTKARDDQAAHSDTERRV